MCVPKNSKRGRSDRFGLNSRRILCIAALILCITMMPSVLSSEMQVKASQPVNNSKTVRVGYYENEVFEEGAREGEPKTGYAYDYYRKISEYTGWKYEYVYGDFLTLYGKLLEGEIDLLAGLARREDREGKIAYPELPMGNESYSLVKHQSDDSITVDPESLEKKKIGVLDSAVADVLSQYLEEHKVKADVTSYHDYKELFDAFDNKKIDVLAAEGDGAYGRNNAEIISSIGTSEYYLCVNIRRKDLLDELDNAQAEMQTNEPDFVSLLHSRYFLVSMSGLAFSPDEKEWIANHNSLTVGYLDHYLPCSDTKKNGEATGLVKDIMPAIKDKLGLSRLDLRYKGYESYDDMISAVREGEVDMAFPVGGGLYYSEESGIYNSRSLLSSAVELVCKREYHEDMVTEFAVNKNNRLQDYYIKTWFPDARIIYYSSIEDCLRAVRSGKANCTVLTTARASDLMRNGRWRELVMRPLKNDDVRCFAVPIGNEGLLKLINRGVSLLGEDYALNLAYRYTDDLYTYTFLDVIRDHIGLISILVLATALVGIYQFAATSAKARRQKAELTMALNAAEQANKAKTTFLNNMSHDLRTPVNAIMGFAAMSSSHLDDKELLKDNLDKICISGSHVLTMINDLLEMSRVESGKIVVREEQIHLPDVLGVIEETIKADVEAKQLEYSVDTRYISHEDIITDGDRLKQILLNILSNSVKFSPDGGEIRLQIVERSSSVGGYARYEYQVKDDGIGMGEQIQEVILEPFTREEDTKVHGIQGAGLGMAITGNLVDLMGGTIQINSAKGEGTEIMVSLPCRICEKEESRVNH